ncbi:MAG: hypothetical protein KAG14_05195, partial [Mycoplasmataceae bacterium]|nr:hypothetical protein [Mycoplasmataceae bacterium]
KENIIDKLEVILRENFDEKEKNIYLPQHESNCITYLNKEQKVITAEAKKVILTCGENDNKYEELHSHLESTKRTCITNSTYSPKTCASKSDDYNTLCKRHFKKEMKDKYNIEESTKGDISLDFLKDTDSHAAAFEVVDKKKDIYNADAVLDDKKEVKLDSSNRLKLTNTKLVDSLKELKSSNESLRLENIWLLTKYEKSKELLIKTESQLMYCKDVITNARCSGCMLRSPIRNIYSVYLKPLMSKIPNAD